MQKVALKVFRQLHDTLMESGVSRSGTHPARDGYAALWLWLSSGQPVERLSLADVRMIPAALRLDTAPIARQAVGYILPDAMDWLVLARVAAAEPIRTAGTAYAYPDTVLVWAGWRGERRSIVSGCINLRDTPTVAGLQLAAGKNYGEIGESELTQSDADDDLLMVAQCLSRFYGVRND